MRWPPRCRGARRLVAEQQFVDALRHGAEFRLWSILVKSKRAASSSARTRPGMRRQHQNARADHDRLLDRMGDEQHGETQLIPQRQQFLLHGAPGQRVERGERLVHQQDVRLERHGARDGDAHLHAARQHVRIDVAELGELDLFDRRIGALDRLGRGELARHLHREQHVLDRRSSTASIARIPGTPSCGRGPAPRPRVRGCGSSPRPAA